MSGRHRRCCMYGIWVAWTWRFRSGLRRRRVIYILGEHGVVFILHLFFYSPHTDGCLVWCLWHTLVFNWCLVFVRFEFAWLRLSGLGITAHNTHTSFGFSWPLFVIPLWDRTWTGGLYVLRLWNRVSWVFRLSCSRSSCRFEEISSLQACHSSIAGLLNNQQAVNCSLPVASSVAGYAQAHKTCLSMSL